jgi:ribosomal protein L30E
MTAIKLKEVLKTGKYFIGTDMTVKKLKKGEVTMVFLSNNCPQDIKNQVTGYTGVDVFELKEDSRDLALLCKKQFFVNVISS